MDHNFLIDEMTLTAKMPVMERIYLAKKKRMRQLEKYRKWILRESEIIECEEFLRRPKIQFALEVRLFEAVTSGNLQELSTLLEEEIDPNIRNYEGLTPLHQCCIDGFYEMVYLLLQRGAEVNSTDMDGWTPLHAAATCGHKNIAKLLVQNGANLLAINNDEDMAFEITEDEDVLHFLQREMVYQGITTQMVNEKRRATYSIFKKDIINVFNEDGNIDDSVTGDGATFLHVAIGYFYNDLVDLLLQKGASPNKTDNEGWSPIHVAAYWGNEEALKLLVRQYKVDIEVQTLAGDTPYDLCENQDIKIYIKGLLNRKSSIQNSNLNIDFLKLDFLDIHYIMESQSNSSENQDESPQEEDKPMKFRRRSFDETLPIFPPLFNPRANELASDKRTSFREAKKFAPNIKTLSSERLKDGLTEDVPKPDIEELNESTTKIIGNEPEGITSSSETNVRETNIDVSDKENQDESDSPNANNIEADEECNNNNTNIKSQETVASTELSESIDSIHNGTRASEKSLSRHVSFSTSETLPQNTLSSLKRLRIEQRQLSKSTKKFSDIEITPEHNSIKRSNPHTSDILYTFRQTEIQYNHPSIVKQKKCCKVM